MNDEARQAMIEVMEKLRRPHAVSADAKFIADWVLAELHLLGFVLVPANEAEQWAEGHSV